eukprot:9525167-Heterocapsa_arctica.AAC.1
MTIASITLKVLLLHVLTMAALPSMHYLTRFGLLCPGLVGLASLLTLPMYAPWRAMLGER